MGEGRLPRLKTSFLNGLRMYVLDASVIAKWFLPEEDSSLAAEFKKGFAQGAYEIACPDLLLYEFTNLLRYNPAITDKESEEMLRNLFDLQIYLVVPQLNHLIEAERLAREHDISVYDAIYLAVAKELGFTLVTADKKLYERVNRLNFVRLLGGGDGGD